MNVGGDDKVDNSIRPRPPRSFCTPRPQQQQKKMRRSHARKNLAPVVLDLLFAERKKHTHTEGDHGSSVQSKLYTKGRNFVNQEVKHH